MQNCVDLKPIIRLISNNIPSLHYIILQISLSAPISLLTLFFYETMGTLKTKLLLKIRNSKVFLKFQGQRRALQVVLFIIIQFKISEY